MSPISNSRFFETNCYFMDMSQYEKALAWIKAKAKTLPGGEGGHHAPDRGDEADAVPRVER